MSPDLTFLLSLALRMAVSAAFVGIAATILMCLVFVQLAQSRGMLASLAAGFAVWLAVAFSVRAFNWTLIGGVLFNIAALGLVLPLVQRFRTARMPLLTRRWYDIPLRATLVATLVAIVVTLSNVVGPRISGVIALFPAVFTSLILFLTPLIGGKATAAVLANGQWGLIGFGGAIVVLHFAAQPFGRAVALWLALATCVAWNFGLYLYGRYAVRASARP